MTPLHNAAAEGHMDMIKWLVHRGASVRARDNYGYSPLHRACKNGKLAVVEWLLDNGALEDIEAPDRNGKSPRDHACVGGHSNIAFYLTDRGAVNEGTRVFLEKWVANRPPFLDNA